MSAVLRCIATVLLCARVYSQTPDRPVFTCGGNMTGDSGVFGSPAYPGVYPPNIKCVWRITVPEGRVVALTFRSIDMESDDLCRYDYVDVYSGHSNGQRLGHFCGIFQPGALVSSTNTMSVHMVSDANIGGSGFLAKYSAAHPNKQGDRYCGGRLIKSSGSLKTPNWPEKDYPAGITCSWHIIAPRNQVIELKFEKFDLERDNYCRYDHVLIYNGGEVDDDKRIGKYCGDSLPAPIVSEENQLFVQFLSDLSLTADGFIGHYKFRPKRLPTTTAFPTTTKLLTTTMAPILKYSAALCQQKCKTNLTLEDNYCASSFVITGSVITLAPRRDSLYVIVSIISVYKEGNLAIRQAGKHMSTRIKLLCRKCPFFRRGLRYIIMGHTDGEGLGVITPLSYVVAFKAENQSVLNAVKDKRC